MAHESANSGPDADGQLAFDFDAIIEAAQVFSRDAVAATVSGEGSPYEPVSQASDYMHQVVEAERKWETTIQQARNALLGVDPRSLYSAFLADLVQQLNAGSPRSGALARLLESVAHRGLGITRQGLQISQPSAGGNRYQVTMDSDLIDEHLQDHIVGDHFLNLLTPHQDAWSGRAPVIGGSDVSQHRSAVPVPARYFRRSVPFVLNNAAGALYRVHNGVRSYENVFNPKPDEALLRWMLIDPSYQDELDSEDYHRCLASAMDVGQYKFDLDYLLKTSFRGPDVIFRDGSLFPQDAYLDNFVIQSKRGDFTREAIRDFLDCLLYAREVEALYCGISKQVQLKVYSAVLDWFVAREIDPSWSFGNYTLNDGQAMSLLLASPTFVGDNLDQVVATCLIRRSFTTRATLNTRIDLYDTDRFFAQSQEQFREIDIRPYQRLCNIAHVYMFFLGHSKSPQQQLPRYEVFHFEPLGHPWTIARTILAALQHCSLATDMDHSFMAAEPVSYLLPSVTHHAHTLSKDVGKAIDSATGQWIMAKYQRYLGH
jgi:hypothetical protein